MSHAHVGWSIEDDAPVLRAHIEREHALPAITTENHRALHERKMAISALIAAAEEVIQAFDAYTSAWELKEPGADAEFLYAQLSSALASLRRTSPAQPPSTEGIEGQ